MAVPTRPVAGAPIESAWGDVVHDTAVAQDIQIGVTTITYTSGASFTIVVPFPRPFGGVPVVVAVGNTGVAIACVIKVGSPSTTGFSLNVSDTQNAAHASGSVIAQWIAVGPRA